MYIPKHFQMSESDYVGFIQRYPLATMIIGGNEPGVAQCPLVYDDSNKRLMGHLAFINPMLDLMSTGDSITILFSGNQGYVSANWYATADQEINREVPTCNYSSLEVIGTIQMADEDETRTILEQQTDVFESRVNEDWRLDKLSEQQISAMIKAIRGFYITIDDISGKHKLSQNKPLLIQERLIQRMQLQSGTDYDSLVSAMKTAQHKESNK